MFFFGALVVFAAEVTAFVAVGEHIGFGWAVLALLAVSALGPFMIRRVGIGVWARTRRRLTGGEVPTRELLDGVVVLFGGVLICVPGFLTDALGLLLMVGPLRRVFIRTTGRRVARRIETMSPRRWGVIDVEAHSGSSGRSNAAEHARPRLGHGPRRDGRARAERGTPGAP